MSSVNIDNVVSYPSNYLFWNLELSDDDYKVGRLNIQSCQVILLGLGFYCLQEAVELIYLIRGAQVNRIESHTDIIVTDDEPLLDTRENGKKDNIDPEECLHS